MSMSHCHTVLGGVILWGLSLSCGAQESPQQPPEHIDYWSVWADAKGATHQTHCRINDMTFESFAPPAAPEWVSHGDPQAKRLLFNVAPIGWVGSWHRNPSKQWVVPLEGRWFTETTYGMHHEYGPGELMLGDDQAARSINGHEGHLSGTVGNTPVRLMVMQLDESTLKQPNVPCAAGGEAINNTDQ